MQSSIEARPSEGAPQPPEALGGNGLIQDIKQLPQGVLLTLEQCPPEWGEHMAITVHEHRATLLVTREANGSPRAFELRRRLKERGYNDIDVRMCTQEVVRIVSAKGDVAGVSALRADDATAVERELSRLIDEAIERTVSDIHIETRGAHAEIYMRINGVRVFHSNITHDAANSIGVVLYTVHADASSKEINWNPSQVMDAAIEYTTTTGHKVQLRFSSSPIAPSGNFHIVLRVLMLDAHVTKTLDDIDYAPTHLEVIEDMLTGSSGMVVLCGPTNSGKSTSLQAMMRRLYERRGDTIKMITVEDPVEYVIPGACQIGVPGRRRNAQDERPGSAFTDLLRGALRQDPDVLMVGEIRDHDSGEAVKDMVLTGRKVLTTLHTYSALWAFVRLREVGVPMQLLTMPGFISGIIFQRLVPIVCPHCALSFDVGRTRLSEELIARVLRVVDLDVHQVRVRGDGCAHCNHTGIATRTVVAEFVVPDTRLLQLLAAEDFLGAELHWKNQGRFAFDGLGVSVVAHAIYKMRQGLFDPRDVEDQVGSLNINVPGEGVTHG